MRLSRDLINSTARFMWKMLFIKMIEGHSNDVITLSSSLRHKFENHFTTYFRSSLLSARKVIFKLERSDDLKFVYSMSYLQRISPSMRPSAKPLPGESLSSAPHSTGSSNTSSIQRLTSSSTSLSYFALI